MSFVLNAALTPHPTPDAAVGREGEDRILWGQLSNTFQSETNRWRSGVALGRDVETISGFPVPMVPRVLQRRVKPPGPVLIFPGWGAQLETEDRTIMSPLL